MLKLKQPIQLHTGLTLTQNAESFAERIKSGYDLMGAHFTPKDLLFLMTAPVELPDNLGGMTTLVEQNNRVDVRGVTLDVVNNVVNRILLDGSEHFTYKDQVYITSVLNRLGITNTERFMEEIRQIRAENESTVRLAGLYREELERVLQRQASGESAPVLPIPAPRGQEEPASPEDPRASMSLNILNRLDTANLYHTVYAFQRGYTSVTNQLHSVELRLSEQLRFSTAISLAQTKRQVFQQPRMYLQHHVNRYETGELMPPPKNEDQVLSQAAVAALVTAVDNTVVSILNRPQAHQEQWVNLRSALWQVAENTISRFETYHSQAAPMVLSTTEEGDVWNRYVQEIKDYQLLNRLVSPGTAEFSAAWPQTRRDSRMGLTYTTQGREEDSLPAGELTAPQLFHTTEEGDVWNQYLQELQLRQLLERYPAPSAAQVPPPGLHAGGEPGVSLTHAAPEQAESGFAEQGAAAAQVPPAAQRGDVQNQYLQELQLRQLLKLQPDAPAAQLPPPGSPRQGEERVALTYVTQEEGEPAAEGTTPAGRLEVQRTLERELRSSSELRQTQLPGQLEQQTLLRREQEQKRLEELRRVLELREGPTSPSPPSFGPEHVNLTHITLEEEGAELPAEGTPPASHTEIQKMLERELRSSSELRQTQLPGQVERQTLLSREQILERLEEFRRIRERGISPPPAFLQKSVSTDVTLTHITREGEAEPPQEGPPSNTRQQTEARQILERELRAFSERQQTWRSGRFERQLLLYRERERERLEETERVTQAGEIAVPPPPWRPMSKAMPHVELPRPESRESEIERVVLTAREAEEQAPEALVQALEQINQRNRTILETIQREGAQRPASPQPSTPDIQRTMRNALQALEKPEAFLRQAAVEQREAPTVHPSYTPQEEILLRNASPEQQALYEAILQYQRNPEQALAGGLLRRGSFGGLQADLAQAREESPLELEHQEIRQETELLREQTESVLERIVHLPARYRQTERREAAPPEAPRIVHRQAPPDVTEELLERLEEQRYSNTVRTESGEEITHVQSRQVDVNELQSQVVSQTTQDVTELVNRTLARQMKTISDQVYRQMERRLQTERNRRGRF